MEPDEPLVGGEGRPWVTPFRRVVMRFELAVAGLLALLATFMLAQGLLFGHRDPRHGGAPLIFVGSIVLLTAIVLALVALCLRGTSRGGWVAQLMLIAGLAWIGWEVLR